MPKEQRKSIEAVPVDAEEEGYQQKLIPEYQEVPSLTLERVGFVTGLFEELDHARSYYLQLTQRMSELQGRMDVAERNLCVTRDYLMRQLSQTDEDVPKGWQKLLNEIRFVGVRLGDACLKLLRENRRMTTEQLLSGLNDGQFRFRTGYPLREIHAALLRQPRVDRVRDEWVYRKKKASE